MYIWEDGYKALLYDMSSPEIGFQYELGKEYIYDETPKVGSSGFHFCRYLRPIIKRYSPNKFMYRYFKVKAFYDPKNEGEAQSYQSHTAKIIKILEEVPFCEVKQYLHTVAQELISNYEEYYSIQGEFGFREYVILKCENMLKHKYTDSYIRGIIAMLLERGEFNIGKIHYMIGLHEEGISHDIIAKIMNEFLNNSLLIKESKWEILNDCRQRY